MLAWKELGFRSYEAYGKSALWNSIRHLVLDRDGKCCQVCGTPSKVVHHIDYTTKIMLGEGDQHELITLCEPCHNYIEVEKNLVIKKHRLSDLFLEHSSTTLSQWQIWAKKFNTDICFDKNRLHSVRNLKTRKRKKPKKNNQIKKKKSVQPKSKPKSLKNKPKETFQQKRERLEQEYIRKKFLLKKSYQCGNNISDSINNCKIKISEDISSKAKSFLKSRIEALKNRS